MQPTIDECRVMKQGKASLVTVFRRTSCKQNERDLRKRKASEWHDNIIITSYMMPVWWFPRYNRHADGKQISTLSVYCSHLSFPPYSCLVSVQEVYLCRVEQQDFIWLLDKSLCRLVVCWSGFTRPQVWVNFVLSERHLFSIECFVYGWMNRTYTEACAPFTVIVTHQVCAPRTRLVDNLDTYA